MINTFGDIFFFFWFMNYVILKSSGQLLAPIPDVCSCNMSVYTWLYSPYIIDYISMQVGDPPCTDFLDFYAELVHFQGLFFWIFVATFKLRKSNRKKEVCFKLAVKKNKSSLFS